MKVSLARMNEARELRDIALTLLDRQGMNVILVDRDRQIKIRQHHVGDLKIMQSAPMGEQILDVYHGRKVFSVRWHAADTISVVAFRPGDWRQVLRASGDTKSEWPISGVPQHIAADGCPSFVTRPWVKSHIEKAYGAKMASLQPDDWHQALFKIVESVAEQDASVPRSGAGKVKN